MALAVVLVSCSASAWATDDPSSVGLEDVAELLRGDVRMVVLGDSYSVPWFFRTPTSFMWSWPIPKITAIAAGARQYQDVMRCGKLCNPFETVDAGDAGGYSILRHEEGDTFFALPVAATREIRMTSDLNFISSPGRLFEFRINNHRFIPGLHGHFSDPGDNLRFRMLYRTPEDTSLQLPELTLRDYHGTSSEMDLLNQARGMLHRGAGLDTTQPALAGEVNATWPDISLDFDYYARVRAEVDLDLLGSDTYLNPVGGLYFHVDESGMRTPGFYYSYLADSSWSYEGFYSNKEPDHKLDKRFPRSDLVHWLDATTIDPAQPILFTWHFAPEVLTYDEIRSAFEQMADELDLAAATVGIADVRHLIIIPHMYYFSGGLGTGPIARQVMEDHVQAAFALAEERDNVSAASIYTATDGVLFNGSSEATQWLLDHGFDHFEYGLATTDLVNEPQSGNLLDGNQLHPLDEPSAAFFATILGDILRDAGCPGDLQGNGIIDVLDLLVVIDQWDQPSESDIDGNGVFDIGDVLEVLESWGDCWPVQAPFDRP
ncbi:MAG TPA: hypothetical protein DEO57_08155 [Phycisphaerales bacterium]|nr:hypothetical protein [Phycisphaerales bacterium]